MSEKPRSTKPSSQAPRLGSVKPPSKTPKTDEDNLPLASAMFKDMSIAPQQNKISSRAPAKEQDKKVKSTFTLIPEDENSDEEYDDFEELPTAAEKSNYPELSSPGKKPQSRVPSKSTYFDAKSSLPAEGKASKAKSVMQSEMFKDDAKAKAKSVMQSAMVKDDPKFEPKMESNMFKEDAKAKSTMPSLMFRDAPIKSFIVTKEDKIMSARQTSFASLAPKEQKKQEDWAQKKIKEIGACPEQYDWERADQGGWSGFICNEGRHAMLDQHLEEGLGAIIVLEKKRSLGHDGCKRFGPWYPHPVIMNCYVFVEGAAIEGVKSYDQPAFLGSDKQVQRAKWEYFSENPDPENKKPKTEPPEEWAFEKNVPKPKAEKK
ncbi:hypothetical protein DL95DRAFT_509227 [Leptodontidium sp. 2 PMI_412]|nr:hypothetical protein DL95DRAFT_509227 [Leptodontidium sp. 2 PMI_412]